MCCYETLTHRVIGGLALCLRVEHVTLSLCESLRQSLLYYILHVTLHGMHHFLSEHFLFSGFQLDQLVIDSAMEKREMEHKHATIQQRVSSDICFSQIDQIKSVNIDYLGNI